MTRLFNRGHGRWKLRFICCGREDGTERFETWEEADAFRRSYTSGSGIANPAELWKGGHDRAAIISLAEKGPSDG